MVKGVGFIQGFLFRNLGLIQGVSVKEPPDSGRHVPYCLFVFYLCYYGSSTLGSQQLAQFQGFGVLIFSCRFGASGCNLSFGA